MALNNFDDDQFNPDLGLGGNDAPEPPQSNKQPSGRNFLLAIGIIGVILVLALVLLLLVAPGILSQQRANNIEQAAQINAANTATAMAATAFAQQQLATATTIPTRTPMIVIATSTPVVVGAQLQATSTSRPGTPQAAGAQLSAAELATVSALQTQMAAQGGAGTPEATSTALPKTGFADEYGIPGLLGLAVILIAVIFLSRKLRTSAH